MKITRLLFVSLIVHLLSTHAYSQGVSFPAEIIPNDQRIEAVKFGDFNEDGLIDAVVITREQNLDKLRIFPDLKAGTSSLSFVNENIWVIHIYFQQADEKWQKILSNNYVIPPEYLNGDTPFDGISIDEENSTLRLRLKYWLSIGSWWMSNQEYIFKFQNDKFELIGYEEMKLHRSSHEGHDLSINLSTGRAHLTQRLAVEGSDTPKEEKSEHDFDSFSEGLLSLSNFDQEKLYDAIDFFLEDKTPDQ